jgi:transcriptional regulator with XRE-family HTH domain
MAMQIMRVEEKWILRDYREKLGLTQQQVADKANIQLRQYQRFESGERNLSSSSFNIACRVIEALGLDINKYYHGEYVFGDEV